MGSTIDDILAARGMTRYRLSKLSDVPWATLSDICSGRTDVEKCSAGTVRKLSRTLGMTMEEFMDLEFGQTDGRLPEDDSYLEVDLPADLRKSIDDYESCDKETCLHVDCLIDEIAGSINANLHGGKISERQAEHLFRKYVYG